MKNPWYADGLRFACTRCGNCCTGAPGTVAVSDAEIERLALREDLSVAAFREVYTHTLRGGDVSLRERRDGSCVFFVPGAGCRVYDARPRQCRTYPLWRGIVASPESWASEGEQCPGIGRGPLHPRSEIERSVRDDGTIGSARVRRRRD